MAFVAKNDGGAFNICFLCFCFPSPASFCWFPTFSSVIFQSSYFLTVLPRVSCSLGREEEAVPVDRISLDGGTLLDVREVSQLFQTPTSRTFHINRCQHSSFARKH
jgi:hypothetical protein